MCDHGSYLELDMTAFGTKIFKISPIDIAQFLWAAILFKAFSWLVPKKKQIKKYKNCITQFNLKYLRIVHSLD